jgi:hypothetical protein
MPHLVFTKQERISSSHVSRTRRAVSWHHSDSSCPASTNVPYVCAGGD